MSTEILVPRANISREPKYVYTSDTGSRSTGSYSDSINNHISVLASATTGIVVARPLMYLTLLPPSDIAESSSQYNQAAVKRYNEIEHDLDELAQLGPGNDEIDLGAVNTARQVVSQIRSRQLAPPELSWSGGEAIIMLWILNEKKLALTITDGEIGYAIRVPGKTLSRRSNIRPDQFELVRLK